MKPAAGERVFVGLGANLGDAEATVRAAFEALAQLLEKKPDIRRVR